MELKLASETEIKKYFQTIELKEASYFNDIVIAIYQIYEYLPDERNHRQDTISL